MKLLLLLSLLLIHFTTPSDIKAEQIKLGAIIPLTGSGASMGESLRGVVKLAALSSTNIIFEDDRCDGKQAISAYLKLRDEGVHIFYMACSGSILAVAPLAKRNGDLILTTYAGSSKIRETGDEVIRLNPDAISIAEGLQSLISEAQRPIAILHEEQEYASSLADKIEQLLGKDMSKRVSYRPDAGSYTTEILALKQANPRSILLIPLGDAAAKTILKQMSQYQIRQDIIGEVNLCDYPFKPADFGLHGFCVAAKFTNEAYQKFLKDYQQALGRPPAYPFYDAMALDLFRLIDNSKESAASPEQLKKLLSKGFNGAFAHYALSPDGEITNSSDYLQKVQY